MQPDYLTTAQAGAIIGVNDSRVRQLLRARQLPGVQMGRDWLIRRVDAERFKRTPPGPVPGSRRKPISRKR